MTAAPRKRFFPNMSDDARISVVGKKEDLIITSMIRSLRFYPPCFLLCSPGLPDGLLQDFKTAQSGFTGYDISYLSSVSKYLKNPRFDFHTFIWDA